MKFFDRKGNVLVDMKGSQATNSSQVVELATNEKLVGFKVSHDGNVVHAIAFKIAKPGTEVQLDQSESEDEEEDEKIEKFEFMTSEDMITFDSIKLLGRFGQVKQCCGIAPLEPGRGSILGHR